MDLVLMVGGTFLGLWLSYLICSRYPKHFVALMVLSLGAGAFWFLHLWGKV